YRLLGLAPGESNLTLIEQRVHERLDEVRRYQVAYPEPATEAMNRLAQAFVCLSDPQKKKAYDATLLSARGETAQPAATLSRSAALLAPLVREKVAEVEVGGEPLREEPFRFLYDPTAMGPGGIPLPPVRRVNGATALVSESETAEPGAVVEVLPPPPLPPLPLPAARVPIEEFQRLAQNAPVMRKGLNTLRAVFERITLTRNLLTAWEGLAVYLEDPKRPLKRNEAVEMYRRLEQIEDDLVDFPLLGESGQPGYMILSLTRLNKSKNIVNLDAAQRDSLARDWLAVRAFLEAHLEFLRQRSKEVRDQGWLHGCFQCARALLNEQPLAAVLILGGLVALGIAVWRQAF
ncbi:MAG: hypothetical protein SNJ82_08845, partial [Gemmataceae bacterium]